MKTDEIHREDLPLIDINKIEYVETVELENDNIKPKGYSCERYKKLKPSSECFFKVDDFLYYLCLNRWGSFEFNVLNPSTNDFSSIYWDELMDKARPLFIRILKSSSMENELNVKEILSNRKIRFEFLSKAREALK